MSDFYTNGSCTDNVAFYMNPWYYLVYIFLRRLESCHSVCDVFIYIFLCVFVVKPSVQFYLHLPPRLWSLKRK